MKDRFIIVPHKEIASETLNALIEEFIERDGTFYGTNELSMDEKVSMIIHQLERGTVVITWDRELESSNIVPKENIVSGA